MMFLRNAQRIVVCFATVLVTASYGADPVATMFEGNWLNVDENTRGMTRLVVKEADKTSAVFHGFGSCTPTDCDWNTTPAALSGDSLVGVYDFGSKTTTITLWLHGIHLRAMVFHDYPDDALDRTRVHLLRRGDLAPAIDVFVGDWRNAEAGSLSRIVVKKKDENSVTFHGYGDCTPADCDWGTVDAFQIGDMLKGAYDFGFKTTRLVARPLGRRLEIIITNNYVPDDPRNDNVDTLLLERVNNEPPLRSFTGRWRALDKASPALPEIVIDSLTTHDWMGILNVFGSCTPTNCDWGLTSAVQANGKLVGTYDAGFKITHLVLSESNDTLRADVFTTYADDREDKQMTLFYELLYDNTITSIVMTPGPPDDLATGQHVNLNFDYTTNETDGVRVFVLPYTGGSSTSGFAVSPSPVYHDHNGSGSGWFTVSIEGAVVDSVRIWMTDKDQNGVLVERFIPVDFSFGNPLQISHTGRQDVREYRVRASRSRQGSTVFTVSLPEASRVALAVLDMRGRMVRAIAEGDLPAGVHRLVANGETRSAPAGRYLIQMKTETGTTVHPLLLAP